MTNKEMINKFKDYADCADASYAMLDFVNGFVDYSAWYEKKILNLGTIKVWVINLKEQIKIQLMLGLFRLDLTKILKLATFRL